MFLLSIDDIISIWYNYSKFIIIIVIVIIKNAKIMDVGLEPAENYTIY